jgi:hypothetical protein
VIRLQRVECLLLGGAELLRELGDRRRASEPRRQLVGRGRELERALLDPAGNVDRPAAVAEVALELTEHRRRGKTREGEAAVGIEALNRFEQADVGDLNEVVERLASRVVAAGDRAHERLIADDELLDDRPVCGRAMAREQLADRERVERLACGGRRHVDWVHFVPRTTSGGHATSVVLLLNDGLRERTPPLPPIVPCGASGGAVSPPGPAA